MSLLYKDRDFGDTSPMVLEHTKTVLSQWVHGLSAVYDCVSNTVTEKLIVSDKKDLRF